MAVANVADLACSCGRIACRYALPNGLCAMEIAEEGPGTYQRIAEVMGLASKSDAEYEVLLALWAFVRRARAMGFYDLVERVTIRKP